MGVDPARGFPLTRDDATANSLADLNRRVDALERAATVQETAGAPTTSPRNGTLAIDSTAPKLWIVRGGAWVYVTTSG